MNEPDVTVSADDAPGYRRVRADELTSESVLADVFGGRKPIYHVSKGLGKVWVRFDDGTRSGSIESFAPDELVVIHEEERA